ncbi:MAG: sel1 repeat family protein [Rhodobacteraceae bacterium]|nr:sel1 repeat family protein [Paracoccaceae bacterium]
MSDLIAARVFPVLMLVFLLAAPASAQTEPARIKQWDNVQNMNVQQLEQACNGGDVAACGHFGAFVLNGQGVSRNLERAASLLEESCKGGFAWPCHDLAVMFQKGLLGQQDPNLAVNWFMHACELGAGTGCLRAGELYRDEAIRRAEFNARRDSFLKKGVSEKRLPPPQTGIDQVREHAFRVMRHGCLESRWPDFESCRGYLGASPDFIGTQPDADIRLASARECARRQDTSGEICSGTKRACRNGSSVACDVWIDKVTAECTSGAQNGCFPVLNAANPRHAENGSPIPSLLMKASVDWSAIVAEACSDRHAERSACSAAEKACENGQSGICGGFEGARETLCRNPRSQGCQSVAVLTFAIPQLRGAAARTMEDLLLICYQNGTECADIANALASVYKRNNDRETLNYLRKIAKTLCDAENPGGCLVLGEISNNDAYAWRILNKACMLAPTVGNLTEWFIAGDEVRYAARACELLSQRAEAAANAIKADPSDENWAHKAPLILRAASYAQRACYLRTAQTDPAAPCSTADYIRSSAFSAHRKWRGYASQDSNGAAEHDIVNRENNRRACRAYIDALPGDGQTSAQSICAAAELSSYCSSLPAYQIGNDSYYSCGNIQCLVEFSQKKGQFSAFDRFELTRENAVAACLSSRSPRYLSAAPYY